MKRVKSYISGVIVASVLFYVPFMKKWKIFDKEVNENEKNTKKTSYKEGSSLKTIHMDVAKRQDMRTFYGSKLFGKQVLFHKIYYDEELDFQNYAFAGNIIDVYLDSHNKIKFDVQIFMNLNNLPVWEIEKVTQKKVTKDLILRGFVRSELQLA